MLLLIALWEISRSYTGQVAFTKAVQEAETAFDISPWKMVWKGDYVCGLSFENAAYTLAPIKKHFDKDKNHIEFWRKWSSTILSSQGQ